MSKKASAQQPAPATSRTHEAIARDMVAQIDLIPNYTEIMDADGQRALMQAFIEHHVIEDAQEELRSFDADQDRDRRAISAALPKDLQLVFFALLNNRDTMLWIHEEIVYALGIEVGRRLAGAQ